MVASSFFRWILPGVAVVAATSLLAGCTARHYRKSADKEVYGIIQDYEKRIFGKTNEFTIDTRYSGRDLKTITPAEILEDRNATNRRIVNLDQTLDLAVKTSREYQTQKEQLYLTALTLTGNRYEFGPQFFADSTAQLAGTPSSSDVGTVGSQVGVSQLLRTGGKLSASLGNDLLRYFTLFNAGGARNTAVNTLAVNLTQPLLSGFGANNPSVESITQAERNVAYAVRTYSYYQQSFAVDIVTTYFDLLTQKDVVRNNYRNYTNKVETTRYLEARSVDRASRYEVDDARASELGARRSYIDSLASYLSAMDNFKLRLGLPLSEQLYLDDRDLKDLTARGIVSVDVDSKAAFKVAVAHHMEILNAIDKFEDTKRKVRVAADQLRADLGLFASGQLSSQEPDDYTDFDINKLRYTAGVTLNLPVDRLRERNTYRSALVSFESQLRSLTLTLDNYKDRLDRGLREIEKDRLNYLNAVESLRVAERWVENTAMRMEAGRSTIRDVREAQDNLIQAQNDLANIYATYLTARLGFLLNLGVIDTRPSRFWLADPLKDVLSPEDRGAPPLRMPDDQVLPPEKFIEPST